MRGSNTALIVLALLYWMYKILWSPLILHELSREDTSSVITVPAVALIAVCSVLILNDRLLLLPVAIAMIYEFVVSAVNLAIVIFVTYNDDISFEFPYSLIIPFFEAYSTEMRNDPITAVVREACVIIFCFLTLLVTVVQISEIARKEWEIQERREREEEVAQLLHQNLCRLFGFSATDNQGLRTRIALHSIAIRNRIAYSGQTASDIPLATHKRRTRHGVIAIPTVSKAKKLKERRLKSKDYVDKLILRLKIIGDKSVNIDRRKVAFGLPKFFRAVVSKMKSPRCIHRSQQKVLNFIVKEIYRIMPIERDPDVLVWLIRLEIEIIENVEHFSDTSAMDIYAVIGILEQKPPIRVRYQALESMYFHQIYLGQGEEVDNVARACMAVLRAFHKRKGRLVGSEVPEFPMHYQEVGQWEDAEIHKCLRVLNHVIGDVSRRTISKIIRSQRIMETIFIVLRLECCFTDRSEDIEPSEATGLLSDLLKRSTTADWTHLRDRYRDDLRMATLKFVFHQMEWAMRNDGFAAFIATDQHLLNTIWHRIFGQIDTGYDPNGEEWDVGLHLLNYGLRTNESELQRMLGMGFLLPAARYFAKINAPFSRDGTQAGIMRAVLAARPEWKQPFKKAIQGLGTTSHTARLGLTIVASGTKKADYLLE